MPNPEQANDSSVRGEVLRYLFDKNKRNPGYLERLIDEVWQKSPLEDRVTILAVQSLLAPMDPVRKEEYAKACLFEHYVTSGQAAADMRTDMALLQLLEDSFLGADEPSEPDTPYPGAA
jgi:hypothetical protein